MRTGRATTPTPSRRTAPGRPTATRTTRPRAPPATSPAPAPSPPATQVLLAALTLPVQAPARRWNHDPDHWRHNGRNPRDLHARDRHRHNRHWHGDKHYDRNHRVRRPRTRHKRWHGHSGGGGLAPPKGWTGRCLHCAPPLRHRARMTLDMTSETRPYLLVESTTLLVRGISGVL